jgi:hypothetical protein
VSGVPERKAKFYLAGEVCDYASCVLDGDDLYIWYEKSCMKDSFLSNCFRKINLNNFSGVEDVIYKNHNLSGYASTLIDCSSHICVSIGGAVFRKEDMSLTYLETEDYLSINGWSKGAQSFFYEGFYYRSVNSLGDTHKGYDVVDVESWEVIRHLDLEMDYLKVFKAGLCCGILSSNNFAISSLPDAKLIFELDILALTDMEADRHNIQFDYSDTLAAVVCGDTLAIIDSENRYLLRTTKISELNPLHIATTDNDKDMLNFFARGVRLHEHLAIVNSTTCIITIDTISGICCWARLYPENVSISIACIYGDLIFCSKNDTPHAWDKYTGETVWRAANGLPCRSVQVSKGWVVYHQICGHIHCFQWKVPYISPHRPA